MRLIFDVHGEKQINRRLVRFESQATDATPAFLAIYAFMLRVEKMQFSTQGSQSGHAWADLAASTVVAKQREGLRPEILRATDALMNSLTREGDPNQLKIITPSSLAFGSTLPYAPMHQKPGPAATYPQRRPVDFTEENKVAIAKSLQLWIARGIAPPIQLGNASWVAR